MDFSFKTKALSEAATAVSALPPGCTRANPLGNVSQGGGVFISFRASDEELALLANSEA